jgi:hypothetical protein
MIAFDKFNGICTQHVDDTFRVALRDIGRREIACHTGLTETEAKDHLQLGLRLCRKLLPSPTAELPAQELPANARLSR